MSGTERVRENPKQGPHCQRRARCGAQTHKPRDHDLSGSRTLNRLSHPGAPKDSKVIFTHNLGLELITPISGVTHSATEPARRSLKILFMLIP